MAHFILLRELCIYYESLFKDFFHQNPKLCKLDSLHLKKHFFSVSMQMTHLFHLSSFDLLVFPQSVPEPNAPAVLPPSLQDIEELSEAVTELSTVEEVMKYLEPERWQMDMEELYKPTWHVLGKSFIHSKKARGRTLLTCLFSWIKCKFSPRATTEMINIKRICFGEMLCWNNNIWCIWGGADLNLLREEVQLYSCTPRNFSVSLREELKRTDVIFWPSCLLVKRCGGNCSCCSHRCYDCQCIPARVTKKYHEVNINLIMAWWSPFDVYFVSFYLNT